ncbi:MAG: Rrf2 family transcriptional regulator [Elusimicrobia bacterium]|nr:Rrf2 family transcriptional regulator [Elusimicrobiota bacterium]
MVKYMFKANSGKNAVELRFLFLSPASRQALLGMRAVALGRGPSRYQLVREAAGRAGLPGNALAKIFQRLARHRLLLSQRGPGGGYALARPAREIFLTEILRAVQDVVPGGRHCLLGNRLCGEDGFCLIHNVIIKADQLVLDAFSSLTLSDLAKSGGWR